MNPELLNKCVAGAFTGTMPFEAIVEKLDLRWRRVVFGQSPHWGYTQYVIERYGENFGLQTDSRSNFRSL